MNDKTITATQKQIKEAVEEYFAKLYDHAYKKGKEGKTQENDSKLLIEMRDLRVELKELVSTIATKSAEVEQKRIKEIIDMEYHRIMFVAYPYAGIQIKDLSNLKRAMFDHTKRGDKARTLLSEAVKLDLRERKIESLKKEQQ